MKNRKNYSIIALGFFIATLILVVFGSLPTQAAVTNTAIARLATSSAPTIGPQASTRLFDVRLNCANRVISTKGQAIMLGFNASSTLMGGFYQAASTTVSYPSNQFGCGIINVLGITSSSTIDIAEFIY